MSDRATGHTSAADIDLFPENKWKCFKYARAAYGIVELSRISSYSMVGIAELITENSLISSSLLQALPYFGIAYATVDIISHTLHRGERIFCNAKRWPKQMEYLCLLLKLGSGTQLMYFSINALGLPLASVGFGLLCNSLAIKAAADFLVIALELGELLRQGKAVDSQRMFYTKQNFIIQSLQLIGWGLLALGHPAGLAFLAGIFVTMWCRHRFFKPPAASTPFDPPSSESKKPLVVPNIRV
jgi:hypothetical protein